MTTRRARLLLGALAATLAIAGCSGDDDIDADAAPDTADTTAAVDDAPPVAGGELVYAVEAESSGGFCLPEAQLAGGGITISRTIYDTLTAQTADGTVEPYLAESFEPSEDFTTWTITLREGITFHDGSPLDAQIVADNLNAYRGAYEARKPLLGVFVYKDVADVQVTGPLEVTVTTTRPWPTYPDFLSQRPGMIGRAQLDASSTDCANQLVGTGPFMLDHWTVNDELVVTRNPSYWRTDDAGNQLPYLDKVTFVPIPDDQQRVNALESGQIDALQNPSAGTIGERLRPAAEAGDIELFESGDGVVSYILLNTSKPPFDNRDARLAVAYALDRQLLAEVTTGGVEEVADGPFPEGTLGYTDDTGFPQHDLDKAREHADAYEAATGTPLSFTFSHRAGDTFTVLAQELQTQWGEAGIEVTTQPAGDQATTISTALSGGYEALSFAGHGPEDPDKQYIWWYEGSPVNFNDIADPEINRLLDAGRTSSTRRDEIYQELNRRFGSEVYDLWLSRQVYAVAYDPSVHGLFDTTLPSGAPYETFLAPLTAAWVEG
jgi:peptide/nickel transport system substrate-binding protein